jgi:tetratricopeptide (TPR) repeat protein
MKKTVIMVCALVAALGAQGCQRENKQQQQMNYTAAPMPALSPKQIDQLQAAAKAAPKNPQAWISLGDALMDAQRFGEAVEAYQKALAIDPKNVPVLVDQGTCYRGTGKFDKAVEQYRKAIKIDPDFPNGHRNLGVVLGFDLNKKTEAIKEFTRYLELAPNGPDADSVRQAMQELAARK